MTPEGGRIYGYGRASTKRQVDSPEVQKELIHNYVSMQKLGVVDSYFVDSATSGSVDLNQRKAGFDMISRLKPGDHLIISKLDRAFRKLRDCVAILEDLEKRGVSLHICNLMGGAIDLSSPMGRFLMHILAAFAELERSFIRERTREGLAHKAKAGFKHTRDPGYGFEWTKIRVGNKTEQTRKVCTHEREVMKQIVLWRLQENPLDWREIAKELTYNRNEFTKAGKRWNHQRVSRAFQAELWLQSKESLHKE